MVSLLFLSTLSLDHCRLIQYTSTTVSHHSLAYSDDLNDTMKPILIILASISALAYAAPTEANDALINREAEALEATELEGLSKRQSYCSDCKNGKRWCTICSGGIGGCVGNYYKC